MGFCDFGPPRNVVRMAVAACLWPTTFKIPSVPNCDAYAGPFSSFAQAIIQSIIT